MQNVDVSVGFPPLWRRLGLIVPSWLAWNVRLLEENADDTAATPWWTFVVSSQDVRKG